MDVELRRLIREHAARVCQLLRKRSALDFQVPRTLVLDNARY